MYIQKENHMNMHKSFIYISMAPTVSLPQATEVFSTVPSCAWAAPVFLRFM